MSRISEKVKAKLVARARAASKRAYAPYSSFPVGAAVLTTDGLLFDGCNVENASLGLTICAERSAIFKMVSEGGRKIRAIAIYTPTSTPSPPCGACRQVLNEFGADCLVVSACDGFAVLEKNLSALLPGAFGPTDL
jgi:cytidine deaminase